MPDPLRGTRDISVTQTDLVLPREDPQGENHTTAMGVGRTETTGALRGP